MAGLFSSTHPPLVIDRLLCPTLGGDSTQFVPIMVIGAIPEVLGVHPKVGAGTVAELIAFADTVCDNLEGSLPRARGKAEGGGTGS